MERPICPLCSKRHYSWEGHIWSEGPAPTLRKVRAVEAPKQAPQVAAPVASAPVALSQVNKPKFDRRAYQRELMRKRRAAERERETK